MYNPKTTERFLLCLKLNSLPSQLSRYYLCNMYFNIVLHILIIHTRNVSSIRGIFLIDPSTNSRSRCFRCKLLTWSVSLYLLFSVFYFLFSAAVITVTMQDILQTVLGIHEFGFVHTLVYIPMKIPFLIGLALEAVQQLLKRLSNCARIEYRSNGHSRRAWTHVAYSNFRVIRYPVDKIKLVFLLYSHHLLAHVLEQEDCFEKKKKKKKKKRRKREKNSPTSPISISLSLSIFMSVCLVLMHYYFPLHTCETCLFNTNKIRARRYPV